MPREVNIKALVSHVVKGDGIHKCRICMGDTSEGQVYLGDTVMMDGDKPVTLSELLEIITGVEVQLEDYMPAGLCTTCSTSALNAAHFRTLCKQALEQWETALLLLANLQSLPVKANKAILIILGQNKITIVDRYPGQEKKLDTEREELKSRSNKFKREKKIVKGCHCSDCGKKFKYPQHLHQHLKESTDFKRACHICARIMTRDDLVTHMKDEHGRKPYDCKKCPALLHSYSQFKRHVVKAHSKGSCFCGDCGRSFKSPHAFHAHQSVHRLKTCPRCDKLFRNQTCYLYHVKKCCNLDSNRQDTYRTKHKVFVEVENRISDKKIKVGLRGSTDKQCICDYCGKKFAGKRFVGAHIQIVHTKNTHKPCIYCGKLLAAAHMTEHVKTHEMVRIFTCDHCGIVLRTKLGYIQHLRLHTGEKPYKCQYCGETFSASSRKSEHIRKNHKSSENILKHACELCPARFRLPYRLKKHVAAVHNSELNNTMDLLFECEDCSEKFASYRGLLHHGRKHQGQFKINRKVKIDAKFKVSTTDSQKQTPRCEENVWEEAELPRGTCRECYQTAVTAVQFRQLVWESARQWSSAVRTLSRVPKPTNDGAYYICYGETTTIIQNQEKRISGASQAAKRLNCGESRKIRRIRWKFNSVNTIKCRDCQMKFPTPYHLNQHFKSSMLRVCTQCSLIMRKGKLAKHLLKRHNKKVFSCNLCHQLFDEIKFLNRHVQSLHGPGTHHCKICGSGFLNARALRAHNYTHTLFSCSFCNASFENRKCYKHHKNQCNDKNSDNIGCQPQTYECHDCGSKYTKKPSLRIHIIQKHLNVLPFICQVCGKRSSNAGHAKAHAAIHMTERKVYQCYCGAKMRTQIGYHMHQRIHTGEKPYQCSDCGDRFLSASRRLDHVMRRHRSTKDMKHVCKLCNARFLRPFELKKHQMNIHGGEVKEETSFPQGLCAECTSTAVAAFEFKVFVQKSNLLWTSCLNSLTVLPGTQNSKSLYAIVGEDMSLQTVADFTGDAKVLLGLLLNKFKKRQRTEKRVKGKGRTGPPCKCTDCGKAFLSPYYLNLHLKNSGQKEACWFCGVVLMRGKEMKDHLLKKHYLEVLSCPDCPKLFTQEIELKIHIKNSHKPGALTCGDCGRSFPRHTSFEAHSQMHAVRTCRACGTQFTSRGCYREHRKMCEPDAKPDMRMIPASKRSNVRDPSTYTCDYCAKTYRSRPQLKNHIIWIHMDVRPHQCQWCGKRFYTPARLAEHTVVHTRERNFECDICGAKLVSKMAAVYHRRRHTGERPYECEDCEEKFISASRRSEHAKRRHGKGLRMQCMQCHANFVRGHELRKHMEKAHS